MSCKSCYRSGSRSKSFLLVRIACSLAEITGIFLGIWSFCRPLGGISGNSFRNIDHNYLFLNKHDHHQCSIFGPLMFNVSYLGSKWQFYLDDDAIWIKTSKKKYFSHLYIWKNGWMNSNKKGKLIAFGEAAGSITYPPENFKTWNLLNKPSLTCQHGLDGEKNTLLFMANSDYREKNSYMSHMSDQSQMYTWEEIPSRDCMQVSQIFWSK